MADTMLEQARAIHEDLERLERLIVKDFKQDARTHKEKLMQGHRVRKRLDTMQELSRKLAKIYQDEDRALKDDIEGLASAPNNQFAKFYDRPYLADEYRGSKEGLVYRSVCQRVVYLRLKEARDYHRRFTTAEVTEAENDEPLLKEEPHVDFTGDEGLGRYLDLHEHFLAFVNAKFGKQLEYYEYIGTFANTATIPRQHKGSKQYRDYLQRLLDYLVTFFDKTQPLSLLPRQLNQLEEEFPARWEAGEVPGWQDRGLSSSAPAPPGTLMITGEVAEVSASTILDVKAFESVEELETAGADRLKEALQALGLKCGGTARARAERLFLTKGVPLESLDKKLFVKGFVPGTDGEAEKKATAPLQAAALLEQKLSKMAELLTSVIGETKARVEKKAAQTYEELQAEQEEAEAEAEPEGSDEEEEYVYNPLKLPLGWDGKPIPYWLYKLHGLNQEFKCEICGNNSYWGRRAYEKHFKEWRHQNGMRALGIPNNKNFYEVTKIDEALELHKAMSERHKGGWKPEIDEEFEDKQGNVYNKKTYDDMKRQGLID